jgi:hypothetical protein
MVRQIGAKLGEGAWAFLQQRPSGRKERVDIDGCHGASV